MAKSKQVKNSINLELNALKNALRFVQKTVPVNPQLPILSSILFSLNKEKLTLAATDLYFGIRTNVICSSQEETSFAVVGNTFRDIVSTLSSDLIEIQEKNEHIEIKSNGSSTKIPTQSAQDYPDFPQVNGDSIIITKNTLKEINELVVFAAGSDQARPVLTTLLLEFCQNELRAVATDGFRLALLSFQDLKLGKKEKEASLMLSAKHFSEVCRIVDQSDVDEIEIVIDKKMKQSLFKIGYSEVFVRLVEGEYPPYQKIIPNNFNIQVEMDARELKLELQRAAIMVKDTTNIVKLSLNNNVAEIKAITSNKGEYKGKISIHRGEKTAIDIAFNVIYLLDLINNTKPETITLLVNEPLKPAMFKVDNKTNFSYTVMPFRVSEVEEIG